jgi:hypothetical protein
VYWSRVRVTLSTCLRYFFFSVVCNPNHQFRTISSYFEPVFFSNQLRFAPFSLILTRYAAAPTSPEWTLSDLTRPLGYRVIRSLNDTSLCMTTHLVATLVLVHRHGISLDQLVPAVDWLREEVRQRGSDVVCVEGIERRKLVENALGLLRPLVRERSGYRIVEVAVSSFPKDFTNMIALGYYRNKIIHLFAEEGIWATALCAREPSDVVDGRSDGGGGSDATQVLQMKSNGSLNGSIDGGDLLHLAYLGHGRSELKFVPPTSTSSSPVRSPRARATAATDNPNLEPDIYLDLPLSSRKSTMRVDRNMKSGRGVNGDGGVCLGSVMNDVLFLSELLKREFVGMKVLDPEITTKSTDGCNEALMDSLQTLSRRGVVSIIEDAAETRAAGTGE